MSKQSESDEREKSDITSNSVDLTNDDHLIADLHLQLKRLRNQIEGVRHVSGNTPFSDI
ncbi:hypothetical protein [Kordiimonas sp. SCSIO 12610]|uniref:hypothetical protein n=1 Tax=Kordiimonas sp. SCSIO 12610 TaxID=2829597 RepID=UPI00210BBA90|nr:hypothetical protein [Kordiimonas sp. SCSIO 12610]UTW54106.1 hypothetical protein KFF44_09705 [Kordiimonas sp. SCSIO 12610]